MIMAVVNFNTELEKEWYILTPSKHHGSIEKINTLSYNSSQEIETFVGESVYLERCIELGIEINEN